MVLQGFCFDESAFPVKRNHVAQASGLVLVKIQPCARDRWAGMFQLEASQTCHMMLMSSKFSAALGV